MRLSRIAIGAGLIFAVSTAATAEGDAASERALAKARAELLAAVPTAAALAPEQLETQNERAKRRARSLSLVDGEIEVVNPRGTPLAGIRVRALHPALDVSDGPHVTDTQGRVTARLPRGMWTVDVATAEPRAGQIVFGRTDVRVGDDGRSTIRVGHERTLRFRSRAGSPRQPDDVRVSLTDFSFHAAAAAHEGRLDVTSPDDRPVVVQAVRHPDRAGGYVVRETVDAKGAKVVVDGTASTAWTYAGVAGSSLAAHVRSADVLPFDLHVDTRERRTVSFSGLTHAVTDLVVRRGKHEHAFYPRPFELDGKARTFEGQPPFEVFVGHDWNWFSRFRGRRYTLSVRVFLQDSNGLLLRGARRRNPYPVAWEQLLDGNVIAKGEMTGWYWARSPKVADQETLDRLRYRLHIKGPGENRTVELPGREQDVSISVGNVRTTAFPPLAPNVRKWAECVRRIVASYEDTNATRRSVVNLSLFSEMPPGITGWGGWRGSTGFSYLPEGKTFGFVSNHLRSKLVVHEMGHVAGYMHGNSSQRRTMIRAGNRAGRRQLAMRPGMERVPYGNRLRPFLEALTRGDLRIEVEPDGADDLLSARDLSEGRDGAAPDKSTTDEDDVLTWIARALGGIEADRKRRGIRTPAFWALISGGFSNAEAEITLLSAAAGENLAWLGRLRAMDVSDVRIDAALARLAQAAALPSGAARRRVAHHWSRLDLTTVDDLHAAAAQMLAEAGWRSTRIATTSRMANEALARGDPALALKLFGLSLSEARKGTPEEFGKTLEESAAAWATRKR